MAGYRKDRVAEDIKREIVALIRPQNWKQEGVCDKCGGKLIIRKDDKPETIKDRLAVYHEQTAPLADYYRKAGKLFTVDGTQEISAITAQLLSILEA